MLSSFQASAPVSLTSPAPGNVPGLPDPEDGAGRVGEDRHPAEVHHVHRLGDARCRRPPDRRRGGVGVVDRDVGASRRAAGPPASAASPGDRPAVHLRPCGSRRSARRSRRSGTSQPNRLAVEARRRHPGRACRGRPSRACPARSWFSRSSLSLLSLEGCARVRSSLPRCPTARVRVKASLRAAAGPGRPLKSDRRSRIKSQPALAHGAGATDPLDQTPQEHDRRLPGRRAAARRACAWSSTTGRKIGVFNCDGTLYAIEDRCSHDDGPLAEGEFDAATCTVECPRHGSLFDLTTGRPKTLPAYRSGADVPGGRRGRHHHPGGRLTMATPEVVAEKRELAGINADYKEKFGFHDPETRLRLQGAEGPHPRGRRIDLRVQGRAAVDARLPAQGARALRSAPDPEMGRQPRPDRLRRHPLLRPRLGEEQPRLERGPGGHQEHLRPARHPRGGAQIPLRRRRPVRVRGRLPPGQREARGPGRDLHRHGHRPARARGPGARVLGDDHPAQRQQTGGAELGRLVGRLLRLRAGRGQGRDAAAGLLPDQHREHGPVRADADHLRGGRRRPLHRGLHGAGLLERLAALGGGRDRRQAELAGSATRPSRTGRRTSSTSSPSAPSRTRRRRWSGSTATSARN